jgi:uncharacterized protein (DUF885 family)
MLGRMLQVATCGAWAAGCGPGPAPAAPADPAGQVVRLADEYVAQYFKRVPETGTRRGITGAEHDRIVDNSLAAVAGWRLREDGWLREIRAIDPEPLAGRPEWITYSVLRELLEDSVASRVCRGELWRISSANPGWQVGYAGLARIQPVGSDERRADAMARARALPRFVRTEMVNLREGLREGYTASGAAVDAVVRQLDAILALPPERSPFASPAERDSTPAFRTEYLRVLSEELYPAMGAYRDFLAREYRPRARPAIGVSANPDGAPCYAAAVRRFTTLSLTPSEVYRAGEEQLAAIEQQMQELAEREFGTRDLPGLMRRLREDSAYTFRTRAEILARSTAAIVRARDAMPRWFGRLPEADLRLEEYPEFQQRAGAAASYSPAPDDNSRPAMFFISTYQPERTPRAPVESTAFHEAIPGHHLQSAIASELRGAHPITRYFVFSGFSEGWALYAEQLADEMGLYSGELDRLGMLDARAWRAARLMLDAGIHTRGWTREQAVTFLQEHNMASPALVQGEIDRYISWPGQATAYMIGNLALLELRRDAERRLGARFDIREFHDQVLGNGNVTLPIVRQRVEAWIESHP